MTDSSRSSAAVQVSDAQINAARTKLIIDEKLKRTSKPEIEKLAALKTTRERHPNAS
ncbi:hypothetical protein [Rhodococcus sp. BH5]|uniref:hypothetical protein n=1 Tax=Rhodococcus sp. BH5 TaxID=2871702 RepID=UPI0022CD9AEF|nr:hypothetical protein [Rhodococcus sp. BH5]MCZ9634952.1 hypothetical protein [Rhodococcus sp. BH5]